MIRPIHAKMATLFLAAPCRFRGRRPGWAAGAGAARRRWPAPPLWRRWRSREVSTSCLYPHRPGLRHTSCRRCRPTSGPPARQNHLRRPPGPRPPPGRRQCQSPCPPMGSCRSCPPRARQTRPSQRRRRSSACAVQSPGCHIPGRQSRPAGQSPLHPAGQSPPRSRAAPARRLRCGLGRRRGLRLRRRCQSAGPAGQNRTARGPSVPPRWCPAWAAAPPSWETCALRGGRRGRRLLRARRAGAAAPGPRGRTLCVASSVSAGASFTALSKSCFQAGAPAGAAGLRGRRLHGHGGRRGALARKQVCVPVNGLGRGCAWALGPPGSGGPSPAAGRRPRAACGARRPACGAAGRASGCGAGSSSKVNFLHQGLGRAGHAHRLQRNLHRRARRVRPQSGWAAPSASGPEHVPKHHFPIYFSAARRAGRPPARTAASRRARPSPVALGSSSKRSSFCMPAKASSKAAVIGTAGRRAILHRAARQSSSPEKKSLLGTKNTAFFHNQSFLLCQKAPPQTVAELTIILQQKRPQRKHFRKIVPAHARAGAPLFSKKPLQFCRALVYDEFSTLVL